MKGGIHKKVVMMVMRKVFVCVCEGKYRKNGDAISDIVLWYPV